MSKDKLGEGELLIALLIAFKDEGKTPGDVMKRAETQLTEIVREHFKKSASKP